MSFHGKCRQIENIPYVTNLKFKKSIAFDNSLNLISSPIFILGYASCKLHDH